MTALLAPTKPDTDIWSDDPIIHAAQLCAAYTWPLNEAAVHLREIARIQSCATSDECEQIMDSGWSGAEHEIISLIRERKDGEVMEMAMEYRAIVEKIVKGA